MKLASVLFLFFFESIYCKEYLISLKDSSTLTSLLNFKFDEANLKSILESSILKTFQFGKFRAFSADIHPSLVERLKMNPFISEIIPNFKVSLFRKEIDANKYEVQLNAPRHLARISRKSQLPTDTGIISDTDGYNYYYDSQNTGTNVSVYVIDSGIYKDHPEFEGRAKFGIDATGEGPGDQIGHGTHVAGLIGSKTYGVAKQSIIYEVKVLNDKGTGNISNIITGLEFTVNHCKDSGRQCVINMSLGAMGSHNILDKAIDAVINEGIPVVVAAGNNGLNACLFSPASVSKAITVGAFDDKSDLIAPWSNWGSCLDIWAPGVEIESLSISGENSTAKLSGTSMASPIVAGVVALLLDQGCDCHSVKDVLLDISTKGALKRRILAIRSRSPNRIVYTGLEKKDDEYDNSIYPLVDEESYSQYFDSMAKPVQLSSDNDAILVHKKRQILSPEVIFR